MQTNQPVNVSPLQQLASGTILIAISGHRSLLNEDYELNAGSQALLNVRVRAALQHIKDKHPGQQLALLTCLAPGADLLAAVVADELQLRVLPIVVNPAQTTELLPFEEQWQKAAIVLHSDIGIVEKTEQAGIVNPHYQHTAACIAGYADYLLVVWDGVETGLIGGTADIVNMLLEGKSAAGVYTIYYQQPQKTFSGTAIKQYRKQGVDPRGWLYHIPARRHENPFPVRRYQENALTVDEPFDRTVFPLSPAYDGGAMKRWWLQLKQRIWGDEIVWKFLLPILLVVLTIALGTYGFRLQRGFENWKTDTVYKQQQAGGHEGSLSAQQIKQYDWHNKPAVSANDFYNAVNLLTFNSSTIDAERTHWCLNLARLLGLLAVVTGFWQALMAALATNFKTNLKLQWLLFRRWLRPGLRYSLIIGASEMATNLAQDIRRQGGLVILLDEDISEGKTTEILLQEISVFKGAPYSARVLRRLKVSKADEIFILATNDLVNLRTLQEIDQICCNERQRNCNWYVHLEDPHIRDMVIRANRLTRHAEISVVNIHESIARRLLLRYPLDMFEPTQKDQAVQMVIFGNSPVAWQLATQALKQSEYDEGRKLRIIWYARQADELENRFLGRYPCLDQRSGNAISQKPFAAGIRNRLFDDKTLQFRELPLSDASFFQQANVQQAIQNRDVIRIYFCLENSVESVAYLNILARRIKAANDRENALRHVDLQLFCFYNLPDKDEVRHAELLSNKAAPYLPILFFGNYADECTWQALTERSLDRLPMLINYWYHQMGTDREELMKKPVTLVMAEANRLWRDTPESFKESSRQAADHLPGKLRILNLPFNELSVTGFNMQNQLIAPRIRQLAKVEHYRWCRERMMEGYLPLQDSEPEAVSQPGLFVKKWREPKFKHYYQDQKLHIDLLPFDALYTGTIDGMTLNEKDKDISFIEAIPFFVQWLKKV